MAPPDTTNLHTQMATRIRPKSINAERQAGDVFTALEECRLECQLMPTVRKQQCNSIMLESSTQVWPWDGLDAVDM
jgi:hypothetical protein